MPRPLVDGVLSLDPVRPLISRPYAPSGIVFVDPRSLPGLVAWYAGDNTGVTSGNPVNSWPDKSGNGRTLVLSGAALASPVMSTDINGKLAVSYPAGQERRLTINDAAFSTRFLTVFAVARFLDPTNFFGCVTNNVSGTANWSIATQGSSTGKVASLGPGAGTYHIIKAAVDSNPGLFSLRLGVPTDQGSTHVDVSSWNRLTKNAVDTNVANPTYAGAVNPNFQIGRFYGDFDSTGSSLNMRGDLGEYVHYNRDLSDTEVALVQAFLIAKYAL